MKRKLIVTVAVTGGVHRKDANPNLPEQPEEIAQAVYECYNEGASIAHIHARDTQANPTGDPLTYGKIHRLIRERCNIITADTTGHGGNITEIEKRLRCFDADPKPEMASLNMGTLVRTVGPYVGVVFANPTATIERLAAEMLKRDIKPEMEVFNCSMYREVKNLIDKGLVKKPYYVNLVLGMAYQGGVEASPKMLMYLADMLPEDTIFNVSAIGRVQLPMTTMAMVMGGMVRVGMEDNIYYRRGELARSNAQLVARTVRIARELELDIASPDEAREMLGIPPLCK